VRLLRQYQFLFSFVVLLLFCSLMVLRQFQINQRAHNELREAFILLYSKGYQDQARRLYNRLLTDLEKAPDQVLFEDFQRTMLLVDPGSPQTNNLIWNYHWTVSNLLEKRSAGIIQRALKLAERDR
jgi:hypothetical protein